jgi:hypothetical protein
VFSSHVISLLCDLPPVLVNCQRLSVEEVGAGDGTRCATGKCDGSERCNRRWNRVERSQVGLFISLELWESSRRSLLNTAATLRFARSRFKNIIKLFDNTKKYHKGVLVGG